jgi:hypothetical protein
MTEFRNIDQYHAWVDARVTEFADQLERTPIVPRPADRTVQVRSLGASGLSEMEASDEAVITTVDVQMPNSLSDIDNPNIYRGYD